MSDPETVTAVAEGEAAKEETADVSGAGQETPSPSQMDNGLDSIAGVDPQIQRAEEGSNTVHPSEQPDVISSYTGQEEAAQTAEVATDAGGVESGEAEQASQSTGTSEAQQQDEPSAAPGDAGGVAPQGAEGVAAEGTSTAAADSTPSDPVPSGSADAGLPNSDASQAEASSQPEPSSLAEPSMQQAPEASESTAQPEPTPQPDPEAERPAVADGEQPAASTSRPASGGRPPSARPGSARPVSSSRRASPQPDGSRPTSAARLNITPDSVGMAPVPAVVPVRLGGSPIPGAKPPTGDGGAPAAAMAPVAAPAGPAVQFPPPLPQPLPPPAPVERYIAPGLRAIEVEVEQGPGMPHRLVRVLMDLTQCDHKAYLGGFRNKRTGAVYHHAATQTPRAPKYSEADRKLSRETQTVKVKQHSQQTVREQATQMERPGVLMDETYDKEVTPGRYQTADEREAIVIAATRCIQRWLRGWLGRRRAAYLRRKKAEREAFLREQELAAQTEAEEHRRREIQRRMHPRTAADFEVLYNELEAWRLQETRKIKEAGLPKDQEQQVLQQLLHKETKLLQTIDRLKINANQENKEARIQHTLNEMSRPKKFTLRNGGKVDVHTPFTTRAKELQQLYNGLNLPLLTVDERLDVLLHVKWTVKEFDCDLTREVVDLIDREADMLNRGRNPKMLEGLRKRISSLFLNFIETPEFNPEASRFQIVPMDFETYLYEQVGKATAKAGTSLGRSPTMVV
ncbi:hypothetical protein Agub_g8483 [Astrephomene gubernaculifera]|uniref:IQ motif and ubiquitin-like domain-containing protein n=1 Tax=Astrephomene gubernaculifera TaxID=47775 RepID=A0AAD3DRQ6_9CHLO|nr:hypothetical protein Agub_g8483 [Astrephomene gubernaculifera]